MRGEANAGLCGRSRAVRPLRCFRKQRRVGFGEGGALSRSLAGGELREPVEEVREVVEPDVAEERGAVGDLARRGGEAAPGEVAVAFGRAEVVEGLQARQQIRVRNGSVREQHGLRLPAEQNRGGRFADELDPRPRDGAVGMVLREHIELLRPVAGIDHRRKRPRGGVPREGDVVVAAHEDESRVPPRRIFPAGEPHQERGAAGGVRAAVDRVAEDEHARLAPALRGRRAHGIHRGDECRQVAVHVAGRGVEEAFGLEGKDGHDASIPGRGVRFIPYAPKPRRPRTGRSKFSPGGRAALRPDSSRSAARRRALVRPPGR